MTILECYQYINNRLNASSTNSGDNIPKYQFVEAFNTAQTQWVEDRFKLTETSLVRTDEIQQLLKTTTLTSPTKATEYYDFNLPVDYLHYKRSKSLPCLNNILVKEGDINALLVDKYWKPSFEWGETLCTLVNNKLRVYTDNFKISEVELVYYRIPVKVNMNDGHTDVNGNTTIDINPEFQNSSLIEILNLACRLLTGDNADQARYQTSNNLIQAHT